MGLLSGSETTYSRVLGPEWPCKRQQWLRAKGPLRRFGSMCWLLGAWHTDWGSRGLWEAPGDRIHILLCWEPACRARGHSTGAESWFWKGSQGFQGSRLCPFVLVQLIFPHFPLIVTKYLGSPRWMETGVVLRQYTGFGLTSLLKIARLLAFPPPFLLPLPLHPILPLFVPPRLPPSFKTKVQKHCKNVPSPVHIQVVFRGYLAGRFKKMFWETWVGL